MTIITLILAIIAMLCSIATMILALPAIRLRFRIAKLEAAIKRFEKIEEDILIFQKDGKHI